MPEETKTEDQAPEVKSQLEPEVKIEEPNLGDGSLPKGFWITEESKTIEVTIYIYLTSENAIYSVSQDVNIFLRNLKAIEYQVKSKWTIPTRPQIVGYRHRSTRFDKVSLQQVVDRDAIFDELLENHLIELNVPSPNGDEKVVLGKDKRGRLDDKSMGILENLHPTVYETLVLKFVNDANLSL
jgi:hypothetical protein